MNNINTYQVNTNISITIDIGTTTFTLHENDIIFTENFSIYKIIYHMNNIPYTLKLNNKHFRLRYLAHIENNSNWIPLDKITQLSNITTQYNRNQILNSLNIN